MAMYVGEVGRPIDRTAMIEAASRSLRQQMKLEANGRTRDRPRSKGSLTDMRASSMVSASHGSATRGADLDTNGSGSNTGGGLAAAEGEPRSAENAQRRIRSAENEHRMIYAGTREGSQIVSSPSSALDNYADNEEDDPQQTRPGLEDISQLGDLKRPLSRKKDPSASAAAGLGAFSSPVKMTDAFEQRKYRQPIPVESWGPRPPSRHGLPPKATGLDATLEAETQIVATSSRSRGDGSSSVVGGTWAAARHAPMHETRRGRERKAKDRGTPGPEDLGIFGCGTRSPSGQQLTKSFSGVFENSPEFTHKGDVMSRPLASSYGPGALGASLGSWASHVDASGAAGLEVSGCGLGDAAGPPWPSSPAGSCAGSPPTRKGARHSETVSVEDVEADNLDLGLHVNSYRRDTTPPQVIVTRSTGKKGTGNGNRRGREQATQERREKNMPFNTNLDVDFLSLFAT